MRILYNIAIFVYGLLIRMASPFHKKAKLLAQGRRGAIEKLEAAKNSQKPYIWFHCASLGEFEQGRPLIEAVREQYPQYGILLTFFSPSGYEVRKNYPLADVVMYLPADTKRNAIRLLETVRPAKVFFVKYEFWYHYIAEIGKRNIPLYLVSGIFRENQQFFSNTPWGKWYRKMLTGFTHFFVQDAESQQLLQSIGIAECTVSGDTRFDRVAAIAACSQNIPIVDNFVGDSPVLVAGSTWRPDEELMAGYINSCEKLKCIIAPHEVTRENINRLEQLLTKKTIRFSSATPETIGDYQILIVDSIGMLSSLYKYGSLAYIGGGFGVGIHNTLEAATFGLPVIFGSNYRKFKEAREMVELGAAFTVKTGEDFRIIADKLLSDSRARAEASRKAAAYVNRNKGATRIIIEKTFVSETK